MGQLTFVMPSNNTPVAAQVAAKTASLINNIPATMMGLPPSGNDLTAIAKSPTAPTSAPTGLLATKIGGTPVTVGEVGIGAVALGVLYKLLKHRG